METPLKSPKCNPEAQNNVLFREFITPEYLLLMIPTTSQISDVLGLA